MIVIIFYEVLIELIPIIGAGIIVMGSVVTQLYVHRNTLLEQDKNHIRNKLDVVKLVLQWLRKYEMQGKRFGDGKHPHQITLADLQWLERHFSKYGNLISETVHDQYHEFIKRDTTYQLFAPLRYEIELTGQNNRLSGSVKIGYLLNDDLCDFERIAKQELCKLECTYSKIIKTRSGIWWLRKSWRNWYLGNTKNKK